MTIRTWLARATSRLDGTGIGTAHLDALILLEDATGKPRAWLLAHDDQALTLTQTTRLTAKLNRRVAHEPMAYIREKCEFYGRTFYVNKNVLVPRPESETIIDILRNIKLPKNASLADIGTGSGALGITAALELPSIKTLDLYDVDHGALDVATKNLHKLGIRAELFEEYLLEGDRGPYDVIIANLPYVPDSHTINQAAMFEPVLAIFGGSDGLDLYRQLFAQLAHKTWQPLYVITESLPYQHAAMAAAAKSQGFKLKLTDDFIQVFVPVRRKS